MIDAIGSVASSRANEAVMGGYASDKLPVEHSSAANSPVRESARDAKAQEPGRRDTVELTTVTTQCPKQHWHTQECPHTTSTRQVEANSPEARKLGKLDQYI